MSFVIAGTVITTGAGLYSANKASKAQKNASNQNDALAREQLAEDKRRYDADREDKWTLFNAQMAGDEELDQRNRADKERSYQRVRGDNINAMNRGDVAGNQLAYLMGLGDKGTGEKGFLSRQFTEADMKKDGGYAFRQKEGQTGVSNQFAASGGLLSGAAMKALNRFNQDFASNEYGQSYSRFNLDQDAQYNRLMGVQGAGQNAANSVAGNSGTIVGQASNAMAGLANSLGQSSAQMGAASNNYYNNRMGNNNASANANSAYQTAFGNALSSGAGALAAMYKKGNDSNSNYSYPSQNWGGYSNLDF